MKIQEMHSTNCSCCTHDIIENEQMGKGFNLPEQENNDLLINR